LCFTLGTRKEAFLDLVLQPPIWYMHQWCPKCLDGRTIPDIGSFALQSGRHPPPAAGAWGREGWSVLGSYRSGTKDTGVVQRVPSRTAYPVGRMASFQKLMFKM